MICVCVYDIPRVFRGLTRGVHFPALRSPTGDEGGSHS